MTLPERVRFARERRGLGKRELAKKAGLSSGYLTQLENDGEGAKINSPSIDKTRALALALEVPFEWLAFGDGAHGIPEQEPAA